MSWKKIQMLWDYKIPSVALISDRVRYHDVTKTKSGNNETKPTAKTNNFDVLLSFRFLSFRRLQQPYYCTTISHVNTPRGSTCSQWVPVRILLLCRGDTSSTSRLERIFTNVHDDDAVHSDAARNRILRSVSARPLRRRDARRPWLIDVADDDVRFLWQTLLTVSINVPSAA